MARASQSPPATAAQPAEANADRPSADRENVADTGGDAQHESTETAEQTFTLDDGTALRAAVVVDAEGTEARITFTARTSGQLWLHWGLAVAQREQWQPAPSSMQPTGSYAFDDKALRSPFHTTGQGQKLELVLTPIHDALPRGVNFVLYEKANERWLKDNGKDLHLPIRRPGRQGAVAIESFIHQIAEQEVGDHSWTLMHRFNLARDMLDDAVASTDVMRVVFVWLRFSALRQLDWQRKYNTKPRELAHAQHRLTERLAALAEPGSDVGALARLTLASVGRGGEGQQVRDEILAIMHRHHIKERHGTFLEQWHQKLHNNTTPDDIGICEAYIAFLENDGDQSAYEQTLQAHGITKQRLASFERPINLPPDYFPEQRDGLVADMRQFLHLLKSVHAGTDLDTAIHAAQPLLDDALHDQLRQLVHDRPEESETLLHWLERARTAREALAKRIAAQNGEAEKRELLYVDLSVEARCRAVIEPFKLEHWPMPALAALLRALLDHVAISEPGEELTLCARQWSAASLPDEPTRLDVLKALSAAERTNRAVRAATDHWYGLLQPMAERLGSALRIDGWVMSIFAEEVVRGTLWFVAGKVLRHLEPTLRQEADLGGWRIISPGEAQGVVYHVDRLIDVQDQTFEKPTVIVAETVTGEEEIPANVGAVVTPASPDVVSHVAVRARNEHVLVASCLDRALIDELASHRNAAVRLWLDARGQVQWEPIDRVDDQGDLTAEATTTDRAAALARPSDEALVLSPAEVAPQHVGGKSRHLASLREALAGQIAMPAMVSLSFGVFDAAMQAPENKAIANEYKHHLRTLDDQPSATLELLRGLIQDLTLPERIYESLESKARDQGLILPGERETVRQCITSVWASMWTERAYWSRRRLGIEHDAVRLAVLIQAVIDFDYAFVLHTANPMTGQRDEMYGELVCGLGETLVGNAPGQPLAFVADKQSRALRLMTMPSKSIALHGRGTIFRSDSNAEDLPGYAGAGLYESHLSEPATETRIDYTQQPLVQDPAYRERVLLQLVELGLRLEEQMGAAQDIEGGIANEQCYLVQTRPQVGLD